MEFGGTYKLNIGLISADELVFAGIPTYLKAEISSQNFLFDLDDIHTTSPYMNMSNEWDGIYNLASKSYVKRTINVSVPRNISYVYPVINLRFDIQITQGDGSKDNPYLINAE